MAELVWDINPITLKKLKMAIADIENIHGGYEAIVGTPVSNAWWQAKHALENVLNSIATVPSSAMVYQ